MQKFISLFLALLIAVTSFSLGALLVNAEEAELESQKLTFVRNGTTVTVSWVAPKDVEGLQSYTVAYSVDGGTRESRTTSATSIVLVDIPTYAEVKVTVSYNATGKYKTGVVATGSTAEIDKNANPLFVIANTRIVKWNEVEGAYYNVYVNGGSDVYVKTVTPSFVAPDHIIEVKVESVVGDKKETIGTVTMDATGGQNDRHGYYVYKLAGTRTVFWEDVVSRAKYTVILDFDPERQYTLSTTSFDVPEGAQYVQVSAYRKRRIEAVLGIIKIPEYGNFTDDLYTEADTRKVLWNAVDRGVQYDIYLDGGDKPYTMTMLTEFAIPMGHTEVSVRCTVDGKTHTIGTLKLEPTGIFSDDKGTMNEVDLTGFKAQSGTSKKIKLSWDACAGPEKYTIYYKKSSSSQWLKAGSTAKCYATISGLKDGTSYDFKIAVGEVESDVLSIKPSTTAKTVEETESVTETSLPVMLSADNVNGNVLLKWSKVTGATKYCVYIAEGNSNAYSKISNLDECEVLIKDLEAGTYKFRVKAYIDGEWTSLSDCDYIKFTVE